MKSKNSLTILLVLTFLMFSGFLLIGTQYVYAQNGDVCEVTIEKVSDPANDFEFTFSITGDISDGFTLSDPGNTTQLVIFDVDEDADIIELVPGGWSLDDIECTIPTGGFCGNPNPPPAQTPCLTITEVENGLNFLCLDSSEVTCTFTNSQVARSIPTLSQWGLIAMAGILVLIGIWGITRKKADA